MDWFYIPFGHSRKKTQNQSELTLRCDNPQCEYPIIASPVAYDEASAQVYHPGECPHISALLRVMNTREPVFMNLKYISLDKALELLKDRKLKQSKTLEIRLDEPNLPEAR